MCLVYDGGCEALAVHWTGVIFPAVAGCLGTCFVLVVEHRSIVTLDYLSHVRQATIRDFYCVSVEDPMIFVGCWEAYINEL